MLLEEPKYNETPKRKCLDKQFSITDSNSDKYGYLHIVYSSIESYCFWGDAYRHYFYSRLKRLFDTENVVFISKEKIKDLEFLYYKVDDVKITVIKIYETHEVGFIVDKKGLLAKEIKKMLI